MTSALLGAAAGVYTQRCACGSLFNGERLRGEIARRAGQRERERERGGQGERERREREQGQRLLPPPPPSPPVGWQRLLARLGSGVRRRAGVFRCLCPDSGSDWLRRAGTGIGAGAFRCSGRWGLPAARFSSRERWGGGEGERERGWRGSRGLGEMDN